MRERERERDTQNAMICNANGSTRVERLGARQLERSISKSKSKEDRRREEIRTRVYVRIYRRVSVRSSVRSSRRRHRRMHKGRRDRGIGLDQSRFSLVHRFFFFFLYFIHSFSPPLRLPGHTDSPPSVEHCMLTGSRLVGSRSRALQLRRGMHARSANPVLGARARASPAREPLFPRP